MTPNPRYFVAIFGDPQAPDKSLVESGKYDPDPRYAPFPTAPGDVMLLYCTNSYTQHSMEIPGVGIVLQTDNEWIKYRYLPLKEAISKEKLDQSFESADAEKFRNIRFSSHWLFEISQLSFSRTVAAQVIAWDKL
jgi:hypothetical protein